MTNPKRLKDTGNLKV